MACFNVLYKGYWIFDIKKTDKLVKIKIYANLKNINPYNELYRLNCLCKKDDCKMYGFNPFVLTEVELIKDSYDSKLVFEVNRL